MTIIAPKDKNKKIENINENGFLKKY